MSKKIKEKKYLWCENCKCYPNEIYDRYNGQLVEQRKWNGECYEITDSNLSEIEYEDYCVKCNNRLKEK